MPADVTPGFAVIGICGGLPGDWEDGAYRTKNQKTRTFPDSIASSAAKPWGRNRSLVRALEVERIATSRSPLQAYASPTLAQA